MITTFTNFIENRVDEGNAFTAALKKAQEDGDEEFEFDGKTYKTKGDELKEEAPAAPEKKMGKLKTFEEFLKDKEVEAGVEKDEEKEEEKEKEAEDTEIEVDSEEIADADKDKADAEMADAEAEEDQDEDA